MNSDEISRSIARQIETFILSSQKATAVFFPGTSDYHIHLRKLDEVPPALHVDHFWVPEEFRGKGIFGETIRYLVSAWPHQVRTGTLRNPWLPDVFDRWGWFAYGPAHRTRLPDTTK